jgi:hypothetical protein
MKTETNQVSTPTHTPIPWSVAHSPIYGTPFIVDGTGKLSLTGNIGPSGVETAEANAAFIVKAVNSHAELVEALKRINRTSITHTFGGDAQRFQEWIDAFTADAIAKAESA